MFGSNAFILFALGVVLIILVISTVTAVVLIRTELERRRLFKAEGVMTEGEVIRREVRYYGTKPQYFIIYSYTAEMPDGRQTRVSAEEKTWLPKYMRLIEGSKVWVNYVPRQPEVSRLRATQTLAQLLLPQ